MRKKGFETLERWAEMCAGGANDGCPRGAVAGVGVGGGGAECGTGGGGEKRGVVAKGGGRAG